MAYYDKWTLRKSIDQFWGLVELIEEFPKNSVVVEIGTFAGESAELFSLVASRVYTVDPFSWPPSITLADGYTLDQVRNFLAERLLKIRNIEHIEKRSAEAVSGFEDNSIDVVYIDGDHEYASVREDILLWTPKVKQGGLICGHDYNDLHRDGVIKAVDEILGEVKHYYDSSWMKVKT
jgi:predicted O-methyltransferase YrrM